MKMYAFQSTPPCGGRRHIFEERGSNNTSFNPRPRAGGDVTWVDIPEELRVSIHAPVRGATHNPSLFGFVLFVSIHAPVRGATFLFRC